MNLGKISKGLFGGSLILLVTINLFNALNYFFHFVMARMLNAIDYGILVALMSMLYIFNVSTEAIQTIITKYASQESSFGKVKNIIKRSLSKSIYISSYLFFMYLVIAIFLSRFLRIEYSLLALTGLLIFSVFLLPIGRGILQGKKRFKSLGYNMILEAVVKLSLAILFVYIGWKVHGAILGVFLGSIVSFGFSFLSFRDILSSEEIKSDTREIYSYGLPVFVVIFVILAFYSMDVILAKAFFSDELAGQYAIASVLAKIIFFGTLPISKAMFPLSSEASTNDKSSRNILNKSLIILGGCVSIALVVMYMFPSLMVKIFSGTIYEESISILFFLSISMALISFTNLILLYKLSLGKIKNYYIMIIFLVFQIFLLSMYHSNLVEYSLTLIFLNLLFLFGSIFLFNDGKL